MELESLARNQTGPEFGQIALLGFGKHPVKMLGDDQLNDRVSQKLQSLIVEGIIPAFERKTWVRQGLGQ